MDEQWCGYDYYRLTLDGHEAGTVQGTRERPVRPDCLTPDFRALAEPLVMREGFADPLRRLQYRDACYTKIPRALRFNDRISMRASTELREPFLDHRLFELALRQPRERKITAAANKWMVRQIATQLLPDKIVEAPKRALQTPQREWLRGPLKAWTQECLEQALISHGGAWFDRESLIREWRSFCDGASDNSFYVWQWISLALMTKSNRFLGKDESPKGAPVFAAV
jgi:asparagine synthase (glutamine-hydrolysing)